MTKTKKNGKKQAPKQIFVSTGTYPELFTSLRDVFEAGHNVVNTYEFVKKQQLVVRVEDVK